MSQRLLGDWLANYLEFVDNTEPPESFKLWTAVFVISACLRRKCCFIWGSEKFYPNLYVVIVGPSASRKGTAMGPGYDMLDALHVKMAAQATTREALIRELRTSGGDTDVATGKVEFHSNLVIWSKELSVFLGYNNMALMSDLTDWYDCHSTWHYSTKDKERADNVINVWVSLFGATTPTMIQTNLPSDTVGMGLTSRIVFVFEPKIGKIVPFPTLQEDLRYPLMHDLEQIHMLRGTFKYSSGYVDEYTKWYVEQTKTPPFNDERLAGYMGRRQNHLIKLACICCVSRDNSMFVTEADFFRAQIILEDAEKKMPQVFAGFGKNPHAGTMHRVMSLVSDMKTVEYQLLYSFVRDDVDFGNFDRLMKSLEGCGFITVKMIGNLRYAIKKDKPPEPMTCNLT